MLTNVLKKSAASVFCPEDAGSRFLLNVDDHVYKFLKTASYTTIS
jgi:hypothetical protein